VTSAEGFHSQASSPAAAAARPLAAHVIDAFVADL